jgi:lysozyme
MRRYPYVDTKGKITIGVGRNLTDDGLSIDEVLAMLDHDILATLDGMREALPWTASLDVPRLRCLCDVGFNTGIAGLLKFQKMLAALKDGDHETAAQEILASQIAPARAQRLAALMRS